MKIVFLNRIKELDRLNKAFNSKSSSFVCLYGRRRCGKSRLLQKVLKEKNHVYYVGDNRDASLQRSSLAKEISRIIPGFDSVEYRGWNNLFERWKSDAPRNSILAIDEFPLLVASSPSLPSILQKFIDSNQTKTLHFAVCGSSQRMMYGLLFNGSSPLYGRAREILKIEPLSLFYLKKAFKLKNSIDVIKHYALWGGVPRYWEAALDYSNIKEAMINLVLDSMGVLHREPERLLTDELRDTRQASSILSLIGQGCHRISEISARLNRPTTSLTRPVSCLLEMDLIKKDVPFSISFKDTKRSYYKIRDPFLRFWYTFVEPFRSLLESGRTDHVIKIIEKRHRQYLGEIWEDISRMCIPHITIDNEDWLPASRWWGKDIQNKMTEIDIMAQSVKDRNHILVGEAKLKSTSLENLRQKAKNCPLLKNKKISYVLWIMEGAKEKNFIFNAENAIKILK